MAKTFKYEILKSSTKIYFVYFMLFNLRGIPVATDGAFI